MEKKGIEWKWHKIFTTLIVFIFTIGIVSISFMPVLDAKFQGPDILVLVVGASNLMRMVEFMFVHSDAHLASWISSTLTLNFLSFMVLNYNDLMEILK